jgi:hypothetical protein
MAMPIKARAYAEANLDLIHAWVKDPAALLENVKFLLVDGDRFTSVEKLLKENGNSQTHSIGA